MIANSRRAHRRAHWLRSLVFGAVALGLTACGAPVPVPSTDLSAAASPATPVTLVFWHTQTGASAAHLDALARDFHQAHPTIHVRVEAKASDGDLLRQGLAALALNQPPDLILANRRTIAEFARKNALTSLDAWMNDATLGLSAQDRADFFPGLLDAGRIADLNNQIYSLPFDEDAVVLFYNADLLQAAKVATPPRTWEQFSAAARGVTRGNVRGWAMSPHAAVFAAMLYSRGGDLLDETQSRARLDDAGMQALQLIAALTRGGAAYLAESAEHARADFAQGKTALWLGTVEELTPMAEALTCAGNACVWGVANIPQNDPNRPVTAVVGAALALFKPVASGASEPRTRAAWLFARWLTAPEQIARWARTTLSIPVRVSTQTLLAANLPPQFQRLRDGFDKPPVGRALPNVTDAGLIDAILVEMWTSVANGADPADALRNGTTRINRLLGHVP